MVYRKDPSDLDSQSKTTAAQTPDQTCNEGDKGTGVQNSMAPRAILTCRPNSHPFQERHLILDQPVKVGRSVARCRCNPNNAIFDCKVLSRNHALLWYENGKFYLQDTKSSNGTFVNNQRLSKGSEESPAREVCSGDIVQFGVDVVENSRKVTHGCIVATLKLYLPDGKEAKASPSTAVVPSLPETSITSQELHQLSQYLQEALHKEQVLESKLLTLQQVVTSTQESSDNGWKALIEEDRLLSRIEILEGQLQACSKNLSEEKLREELLRLQEDKDRYQNSAKESLRKVLEDKSEAIRKVQDLESSLNNMEDECSRLKEMYKTTEKELQYLVEKDNENNKEMLELLKKLKDAEEKQDELSCAASEERKVLENQLDVMKKQEQVLSAKIECLQADNDFTKQQLASVKARFDHFKKDSDLEENETTSVPPSSEDLDLPEKELVEKKYLVEGKLDIEAENEKNETSRALIYGTNTEECHPNGDLDSISQHTKAEYIMELQEEVQALKKLLAESRENKLIAEAELSLLKVQLDEAQNFVKKASDEIASLQQQLLTARQNLKEKAERIARLEGELNKTETNVVESKDKASILQEQMKSVEQKSQEEVNSLRQQLSEAQQQLKESVGEVENLRTNVSKLSCDLKTRNEDSNKSQSEFHSLQSECGTLRSRIQSLEVELKKHKVKNVKLEADHQKLQTTCQELEVIKVELETRSGDYWKEKLARIQRVSADLEKQLSESQEEILFLKERYSECSQQKADIQRELESLKEEYQLVSPKLKMVSVCCFIPLLVLILATMLAFYPSLAQFTATTDNT